MNQDTTYVGMDVHKKVINVALLRNGRFVEWQVSNEPRTMRRLARKLQKEGGGKIICCYEAGPCGYTLQRELKALGVRCLVIAPSLIPVKPGARIKTDRRDARKLAELLCAGVLTEVRPPTKEEEAVRDLCRCRNAAQKDLLRARHRVVKMLLRRGLVFTGGKRNWTQKYWKWLRSIRLEHEAERFTLEEYIIAVEQRIERVRALDREILRISQLKPYARPVGWLRCFRGIDTVAALSIVAELHEFTRFQTARALMAYLGLVPSEYSSSDSVRRGSITKCGNMHVRRLAVEITHHYRHRPAVGPKLRGRRAGQPEEVIRIADKAQRRLYQRSRALRLRGVHPNKITIAVARELTGFIWAVMTHQQAEPPRASKPDSSRSTENPRRIGKRRVYTLRKPQKTTLR